MVNDFWEMNMNNSCQRFIILFFIIQSESFSIWNRISKSRMRFPCWKTATVLWTLVYAVLLNLKPTFNKQKSANQKNINSYFLITLKKTPKNNLWFVPQTMHLTSVSLLGTGDKGGSTLQAQHRLYTA